MATTFDLPALVEAVAVILGTVTSIQKVTIGVPASFGAAVEAYVCCAGIDFPPQIETMGGDQYGRLTRVAHILVGLAYAVQNGPSTAELALAMAIDDFTRRVLADAPFRALCEDMDIDLRTNSMPDYREWSGREFRHYWIIISAQQTESI